MKRKMVRNFTNMGKTRIHIDSSNTIKITAMSCFGTDTKMIIGSLRKIQI